MDTRRTLIGTAGIFMPGLPACHIDFVLLLTALSVFTTVDYDFIFMDIQTEVDKWADKSYTEKSKNVRTVFVKYRFTKET